MWQIHDFFLSNPKATAAQAVDHFSRELELGKQIDVLKNEVSDLMRLRDALKPLTDKKAALQETLQYINMEIDVVVATTYPPRQGSDKDRDTLRTKLRKENPEYMKADAEFKQVNLEIHELGYEIEDIERNAKNARRLMELFDTYARFLTEYCKEQTSKNQRGVVNV